MDSDAAGNWSQRIRLAPLAFCQAPQVDGLDQQENHAWAGPTPPAPLPTAHTPPQPQPQTAFVFPYGLDLNQLSSSFPFLAVPRTQLPEDVTSIPAQASPPLRTQDGTSITTFGGTRIDEGPMPSDAYDDTHTTQCGPTGVRQGHTMA